MSILISGSTGLIGRALLDRFEKNGSQAVQLSRNQAEGSDQTWWDPTKGVIQIPESVQVDTAIHLAGAPLAHWPWTADYKKSILESRVIGTQLLAEALAQRSQKPKTLICASAIGIYGNRANELLGEGSVPGTGFLAEVCQTWEGAAKTAEEAGIRVVHIRIGLVLSKKAALLKLMTPIFKLGAGAVMGSGDQYQSWIHIRDLVNAITFIMENKSIQGPVNLCTPEPVTNRKFSNVLARTFQRPILLRIPEFMINLALGEMGREMILTSTRVKPQVLMDHAFQFEQVSISSALEDLLTDSGKPD